jgi:hypothetical protein
VLHAGGQLVHEVVAAALVEGHDLDLGAEAADLGEVADLAVVDRELEPDRVVGELLLGWHRGPGARGGRGGNGPSARAHP